MIVPIPRLFLFNRRDMPRTNAPILRKIVCCGPRIPAVVPVHSCLGDVPSPLPGVCPLRPVIVPFPDAAPGIALSCDKAIPRPRDSAGLGLACRAPVRFLALACGRDKGLSTLPVTPGRPDAALVLPGPGLPARSPRLAVTLLVVSPTSIAHLFGPRAPPYCRSRTDVLIFRKSRINFHISVTTSEE